MDWDERKNRFVAKIPRYCAKFTCGGCGFNPDEMERRFRKGHFVERQKDGKRVKTLVFPRKET